MTRTTLRVEDNDVGNELDGISGQDSHEHDVEVDLHTACHSGHRERSICRFPSPWTTPTFSPPSHNPLGLPLKNE